MYKYEITYMGNRRKLEKKLKRKAIIKLLFVFIVLMGLSLNLFANNNNYTLDDVESCVNMSLAPSIGKLRPKVNCLYSTEHSYNVCMCLYMHFVKVNGNNIIVKASYNSDIIDQLNKMEVYYE